MLTLIICVAIIVLIVIGRSSETKSTGGGFDSFRDSLSLFNKGVSVFGGRRALTQEQSFRNTLVIGGTGSGKTSTVLMSSLFTLSRANSSVVVLDFGGEMFKNTSGCLSLKKKRKIYCTDMSELSDGFNPFDYLSGVDDIDRLSNVLGKHAKIESSSDPYWSTAGMGVASLFMQFQFFHLPPEQKNLATTAHLLDMYLATPEKVDLLFLRSNNDRLICSYKALNALPDKTRQSVLSVAASALKLFKSPAVARTTAVNTVPFESFRNTCSIWYICIPMHMVTFLSPLTAVIFDLLFQKCFRGSLTTMSTRYFF